MKSAEFKKYVTKYFAPKLRVKDWKGSGFLYQKENQFPIYYLLGFQINSSGDSFTLEYSIYFTFSNDIRKEKLLLNKITYANAEMPFRKRIPDNGKWFKIPETENDVIELLEYIWCEFEEIALTEFDKSILLLEQTNKIKVTSEKIITPENFTFKFSKKIRARTLLTLAEIYRYRGDKNKVKEYCSLAIELIGDSMKGSALLPLLNEMKNE